MNPAQALGIGLVQMAAALSWTVYALFLPALAAKAGIAATWVPWILLADQLIFLLCDLAFGVAADRARDRLLPWALRLSALAAVSALVFMLIPHAAGNGALLIGLVFVWCVASSAARVPLFALLAKHAGQGQLAWLNNLVLLGGGVAAALAPYLTARLRGTDPTWPFIAASVGLLTALVLLPLLLRSARLEPSETTSSGAGASRSMGSTASPASPWPLYLGFALLALGAQLHTAINSAPAFLKFTHAAALEHWMPLFWVAFNLALLPAALIAKRMGEARVLLIGIVLGTLGLTLAARAPTLESLAFAQVISGFGWAFVIGSVFTLAMQAGRSGGEGRNTGWVLSLTTLAAVLRLGAVGAGLPKDATVGPLFITLPALLWAGALLLLLLSWRGTVSHR
jgi:predicted MFS family arabinose efflux permease